MNKFNRGSIWMTMSQNEVNNSSLPFGSRPIIIISNNYLNKKGLISYVRISGRRSETDTRIMIKVNKRNSVDYIFVETSEISFIESKYLCCYQGDLEDSELEKITNKIANNFGIKTKSDYLSALDIGKRILVSKNYSSNIEEIKKDNPKKIKKMKTSVSDLTQEQKKYIHDNYSKANRDKIAEMFGIYPYERVTNIANYLRTKYKKKGYL